jgi:hypothetical protein
MALLQVAVDLNYLDCLRLNIHAVEIIRLLFAYALCTTSAAVAT